MIHRSHSARSFLSPSSLLLLSLSVLLLLSLLLFSSSSSSPSSSFVSANSPSPSSFSTCSECVAAGYGWSVEKEACGKSYANKECEEEEEEEEGGEEEGEEVDDGEEGEEEEEDDVEVDDGPVTYSWADTELTTHIWSIIHRGDVEGLRALLQRDPTVVMQRSGDGRGALFWAYEYEQTPMVEMLIAAGADEEAKDKQGNTPAQMAP